MKNYLLKAIFVIVLFTITLQPTLTNAQFTGVMRELGIAPFLEELEVEKGSSIEREITLSNSSDQAVTVYISTRDFLPGGRGQPIFIPDDEYNDLTFSLAAWITLPQGSQVSIPPQGSVTIPYKVNPPINAEQGTHYGAIVFSLTDGATLSGLGITQSVATIIIVGYGQARTEGEVNFFPDKNILWWNDKIEFTTRFTNTGLVHAKPKGEVFIKNIFGRQVANLVVNRDAATVLPKSERTFINDWFVSPISIGPYKAEAIIYYGKEKLEARSVQTIWILPAYWLAFILIFISIVIWFIVHGRHWHRRRVIAKHIALKRD